MSRITSDHCITSSAVLEQMIKHAGNQKRKYPEANHDKPSGTGYKKMKGQKSTNKTVDEEAMDSSDEEVGVNEKDLCCVCTEFTPKEIKNCDVVIFAEWAQCDGMRNGMPCKHWTHLKYCCSTRVVRLHGKFFCPHCIEE